MSRFLLLYREEGQVMPYADPEKQKAYDRKRHLGGAEAARVRGWAERNPEKFKIIRTMSPQEACETPRVVSHNKGRKEMFGVRRESSAMFGVSLQRSEE